MISPIPSRGHRGYLDSRSIFGSVQRVRSRVGRGGVGQGRRASRIRCERMGRQSGAGPFAWADDRSTDHPGEDEQGEVAPSYRPDERGTELVDRLVVVLQGDLRKQDGQQQHRVLRPEPEGAGRDRQEPEQELRREHRREDDQDREQRGHQPRGSRPGSPIPPRRPEGSRRPKRHREPAGEPCACSRDLEAAVPHDRSRPRPEQVGNLEGARGEGSPPESALGVVADRRAELVAERDHRAPHSSRGIAPATATRPDPPLAAKKGRVKKKRERLDRHTRRTAAQTRSPIGPDRGPAPRPARTGSASKIEAIQRQRVRSRSASGRAPPRRASAGRPCRPRGPRAPRPVSPGSAESDKPR